MDSHRDDETLHANVEAFEAAFAAGQGPELAPLRPASLLAVLDGSDQDETTLALALELGRRGSRLSVGTGSFRGELAGSEEEHLQKALAAIEAEGLCAGGILSPEAESHERVLHAVHAARPELCVLPCPFSHDLGELSGTTLGTAVEVCATRGGLPLLVVRGPVGARCFESPRLLLERACPATMRAANLALGLLSIAGPPARLAGELGLAFFRRAGEAADDERVEVRETEIEDLLPELCCGLSGLVHQLELRARAEADLRLRATLYQGAAAAIAAAAEGLQVCALTGEDAEPGITPLAHDLVLGTLAPVLLVP